MKTTSHTILPEPNQSTGTINHSDHQMNVWVENRYHKWRSGTAGFLSLIKLTLSKQKINHVDNCKTKKGDQSEAFLWTVEVFFDRNLI